MNDRTYASSLIGKRIEIPVHFDLWMRGARFGTVMSTNRDGSYISVKIDHPQVRHQIRIGRHDYDYMRVLD